MRPAEGCSAEAWMDMPTYRAIRRPQELAQTRSQADSARPGSDDHQDSRAGPSRTRTRSRSSRRSRGQVVPGDWRGGLPLTYKTGPSKAMAHLALSFNWDRKPLYDVVATIPGATAPISGDPRQPSRCLVNGAEDPLSGTSAGTEEARALGEFAQAGWKPARTIIYCFWTAKSRGCWARPSGRNITPRS